MNHIVNVQKAIPANVGYKGFPATVCTSVNNVICHGIPSDTKELKDGDILNIDVTVIKDGFHGDTSRMYLRRRTPSVKARRLVDVTARPCSRPSASSARASTLGDIGHAIQTHVEARALSRWCANTAATASAASTTKTRRCCITASRAPACVLEKGMTFTIEPMVNEGARHTRLLNDAGPW